MNVYQLAAQTVPLRSSGSRFPFSVVTTLNAGKEKLTLYTVQTTVNQKLWSLGFLLYALVSKRNKDWFSLSWYAFLRQMINIYVIYLKKI